jgi:hypothetical protein
MTKLDIKLLEILLKQINSIDPDKVYCKVSDTLLEIKEQGEIRSEVLKTLNLSNINFIRKPLDEVKELLNAMIEDAKTNPSK